MAGDKPIVYTLPDCPTCLKLKLAWRRRGQPFEERMVSQRQDWLNEALALADTVPIIVWPDGRVEVGFEGEEG
ncbi:hypothetical protein HRbin23_00777 [bacterium HR23]|nr:hypothetical protein HRbin23_00777 [bacterium HR23]